MNYVASKTSEYKNKMFKVNKEVSSLTKDELKELMEEGKVHYVLHKYTDEQHGGSS